MGPAWWAPRGRPGPLSQSARAHAARSFQAQERLFPLLGAEIRPCRGARLSGSPADQLRLGARGMQELCNSVRTPLRLWVHPGVTAAPSQVCSDLRVTP